MKKSEALRLAQRKWKKAYVKDLGAKYHDGELRPVDAEDIEKLKLRLARIMASEPTIAKLADWPDDTPLGEYKRACAEQATAWKKWRGGRDLTQGKLLSLRYEVGDDGGLFRHIYGHGNTWEEALQKAGCLIVDDQSTTTE